VDYKNGLQILPHLSGYLLLSCPEARDAGKEIKITSNLPSTSIYSYALRNKHGI
jgi:hypothetical protein